MSLSSAPAPALADWPDLAVTAEAVIVLSDRVWRISAGNPGLMTGPGTNSYLLLGPEAVAVVDPGPADEAHFQALMAAVRHSGRPLRHILLTHTHRDHSPGCAALVAATGARVHGLPPLAEDPSQDRDTVVDVELRGHCWDALGWPLTVLHTPGHVENHLCFADLEQGWVITGDHLIQGSTVVIIPPHGRLADYMASLRLLLDYPLEAVLPGHGRVMTGARQVIAGTLAHRQQREDKVLERLAGQPPLALADLVPLVYDDVAPWLHPVARFSLWAHLIKLEEEGRAVCRNELWQLQVAAGVE
ncbi:MBL fold metallo-hydrolase [Perlucidibaca piscinae]|uniref:MBL fold metallo-hydrolase n=1 Tax=Perlucidibaca piscinae TaxID=392589 RepID=UPI0003B34349|nr:MBL fold metallo-hydrolase [Perlucidibaca piscinae]